MHIFFLQYLELHCNCSSKALFYYHLRFLLTATTVPRHPADTASASTKIAIFVLSPVFGELDTEVASELWETGVLPSWFSDVSGVSFSGAFSFVRSRVYSITGVWSLTYSNWILCSVSSSWYPSSVFVSFRIYVIAFLYCPFLKIVIG